jgi:hypothetical protein
MTTNPSQLRLGSSLQDFLRILQLDPSNAKDVKLYQTMLVSQPFITTNPQLTSPPQQEVEAGRMRLCYDRTSLLPQFLNNPTIQGPFNRTQIDYTIFLQESERIYKSATPESRARYNLANHCRRQDCPTPAVSWMLWQALRFGEQYGSWRVCREVLRGDCRGNCRFVSEMQAGSARQGLKECTSTGPDHVSSYSMGFLIGCLKAALRKASVLSVLTRPLMLAGVVFG